MKREHAIQYTIKWLKKHEDEFGEYEKGKYSSMLALATYRRIIESGQHREYFSDIIKGITEYCTDEKQFTGTMLQMLVLWPYIKANVGEKYEDLKLVIKEKFLDNHNRMDTIDKLLCFAALDLDDYTIQIMVNEAGMELSNIRHWKYSFVGKPLYCRKIHNSFHYSSPYFLIYLLSKIQATISILEASMESVLDMVIIDGYKNYEQLNMLDAGLLLCATPRKYKKLVTEAIPLYIEQQKEKGFLNIPFYYDNLCYENFIGAETYTAAVFLEALVFAGEYEWSEFREDESSLNVSNQLEFLRGENRKKEYTGMLRMKMKEHCMAPFLDEGDEIEISYNYANMTIGDIIVFRNFDGKVLAHRVIDIITRDGKSAYITAADNGGFWGYPVFSKDIIGKVVRIYKHE